MRNAWCALPSSRQGVLPYREPPWCICDKYTEDTVDRQNMYGSRYQAQGICEKQKKEKQFLLHFQTVDGRNFATTTMASETSVSEVIVNIPVIHLQTPVPPISMLKTGLYKSCEIISGKTTSSHVHETAPPQLWYWGYGGERKVQQIAIINLVAKFLPSTVLWRMCLMGFKVTATIN